MQWQRRQYELSRVRQLEHQPEQSQLRAILLAPARAITQTMRSLQTILRASASGCVCRRCRRSPWAAARVDAQADACAPGRAVCGNVCCIVHDWAVHYDKDLAAFLSTAIWVGEATHPDHSSLLAVVAVSAWWVPSCCIV